MGSKKNVDMSQTETTVKVVETVDTPNQNESAETTATPKKVSKGRSKKYVAVRAQVDKTKTYDPFSAVELVKKLSYSKFDGTIVVDAVVREIGIQGKVNLPHSTGQSITVAIASEELLQEIEAGTINFDVLVSTPAFMPKLAKYARVLGPKGLMPNPKNGTVTTNPEGKKADLEKGELQIKSEKKKPVVHITIGKVSMETSHLVENFRALMKAMSGRVLKATISATMSPGVKVDSKVVVE
jgi:large subunit ribosomal protein L1